MRLSPRAVRHITNLRDHYEALGRDAAILNLANVLEEAAARIQAKPADGLPAPRPYPLLAKHGRLWLRVEDYWIVYTTAAPRSIVGVFYETANIPRHLRAP
ncbi:hypothetical protein [Nitrospirillum pindoramense]|uniref:hypothetical protein n=1 Tax=Nitrospirillum amazonense TaxID=28077 RepID=UPI003B8A9703